MHYSYRGDGNEIPKAKVLGYVSTSRLKGICVLVEANILRNRKPPLDLADAVEGLLACSQQHIYHVMACAPI